MLVKVSINDVPPELTSGNGTPVIGIMLVTPPILTKACPIIIVPMPPASNLLNRSSDRRTTVATAKANNMKSTTTVIVPTNPNSSPITAKIKSVCGAGRYPNFCRLMPSPTPVHLPLPKAN